MIKNLFKLFLYCCLLQFPIILGDDDHEHIHIKLHLPELVRKHTHLKTVVKHHFHPKKVLKIHSQVIGGSHGDKIEPDGSFSVSNNAYSLPRPLNSITSYALSESWLPPQSSELMDFKDEIKPQMILPTSNNWDTNESFSKYFLQKRPRFAKYPHFQITTSDYPGDEKIEQNNKNYEDDEDEYMMTEDSTREQPFALQMQWKDGGDLSMPKSYAGIWPRPDLSDLQTDPGLPSVGSNQFPVSGVRPFKNLKSKFRYEQGLLKAQKPQVKTKNKKRKRMGSRYPQPSEAGYIV